MHFSRFNPVRFAHLPTPLEPLPALTDALASASGGGPSLWVKRDDCTGLAGGGNKTRKLEYLLGDALANDADTLITQGAVQSNHVRQTAAAGRPDDTALGGHGDARAVSRPAGERLGDQPLVVSDVVLIETVDVGRVEERDAGIEGGPQHT